MGLCPAIDIGCGRGELSRYSDSLRTGRSGVRIQVCDVLFRTSPDHPCGPPSLLCNGYRDSFSDVKWPERGVEYPPPSSAEANETVQL